MRIFISNPPFIRHFNRQVRWAARTSGGLHPPIYLAYAAATLKKAGFEVKLEDAVAEGRTHRQFLQDIMDFNPDLIVMETSTASIVNDSKLAGKIKQERETPLVFTGPHASALPERTLRESKADIVCMGEYDETLPELAKTIKNKGDLKKVRGIAFKKGKKILVNDKRPLIEDLDSLPWPLRDQLPTQAYSDTLLTAPFTFIITARGCPYQCNYCAWPATMFGHKIRKRDPKKIADEVEYCIKRYKLKSYKFWDDSLPPEEEICCFINGEIKRLKIGDVVDTALNESNRVRRVSGREITNKNPRNIKVFAFHPKTLKVKPYPITGFIRHKTSKILYELSLCGGKKVKVSEGHSVFSINRSSGDIISVKVKDLKKGDFLVTSSNIQLSNTSTPKIYFKNREIPFDNEIMWLLGAMLGDGSVARNSATRHWITLSMGKSKNEHALKLFSEYFGIQGRNRKDPRYGNWTLYIYDNELWKLFANVFGIQSPASNKRMPPFIYNQPKEKIISFLKGYYESDGSFDKKGNYICWVTSSKELAKDLNLLLLMLGERSTLYARTHTRNGKIFLNYCTKVFVKTINELEGKNIRRCRDSPFGGILLNITNETESSLFSPQLKSYYKNYNGNPSHIVIERVLKKLKNRKSKSIDKLKKILNSDIGFERIYSIERLNKSPKYLYDIEVHPNEEVDNFLSGTGIFLHNTFTCDKSHVRAVCEELIRRGIKTPWICNARVDTLDLETMQLMKKSGCYLFKIGVESGDQEILDWIKKGTKLGQIRSFFKLMKRLGIQSFASFMVGYPQETPETIEQTFELAKEIQPDMCQFVILQPLPGTELWDWMQGKGMIPRDLDWGSYMTSEGYVDLVFRHPRFSQGELRRICSKLWSGYYLRPGYIMKRLAKPGEFRKNIQGIKKIFRYRNV